MDTPMTSGLRLNALPTLPRLVRPALWTKALRNQRSRRLKYHAAAATLPGYLVGTGAKWRGPRRLKVVATANASFPPENYNWEICTQQNYAQQDAVIADGPLSAARRLVDTSYHGHYTLERQQFQDRLVSDLVSNGTSCQDPRLIFTAGAMGVGKSHVIRWMAENDILLLQEFVHINPDELSAQLPEYQGYIQHNRACAAVMTRLEAGLLTELSLIYALQQKRNILVDSSLRHGSWYARVLEKIRQKLPHVRVVLMYIHAREDTVYHRANERGVQGRVVSQLEVADSLEKLPLAIQKLLPYMDTFIQVDNDGKEPKLTSVCQQPRVNPEDGHCDVMLDSPNEEIGWNQVRHLLEVDLEPAQPLSQPPEILPGSPKAVPGSPNPLSTLFRTIQFAARKHQHQTRKNPQQTPYINHPLAVARILAESGVRDLPTLQAALLHDTLEDTDATRAELDAAFGGKVGALVAALTDEEGLGPLHQKFRQLRRVKSLPLQAKLVRIADKMHNVWDLMRNGIPGWSQSKTERYVAWACEMVAALRGTHSALEQRFHSEVSLPKGYQLGDWEEFAVQEMGSWQHFEDLPGEEQPDEPELEEQRAVLSLLRAAEHVASQSEAQLRDSVKFALLLANHGVKDPETLKAGLLLGSADGNSRWVARQFGNEVSAILREIDAQWPRMVRNHKAKRLLLGKHLHELRQMCMGTISSEEELELYYHLLERTMALRETLRGVHPPLEQDIDIILSTGGHVRLATGELAAVSFPG